jgi:hypothetical protein
MEPTWVRAVYLHVLCLVGIVIMVLGSLGAALGVVHLAAPRLKQSDPLSRVAIAVVDVVDAVSRSSSSDVPPAAKTAVSSTRHELDRQARNAAWNDLFHGLLFFGLGLGVYRYHYRRTDAGRPQPAAAPAWSAPQPGPTAPTPAG